MSDHHLPWLHMQGEPADRTSSDEAGATKQDEAAALQESSQNAARPAEQNGKVEGGDKRQELTWELGQQRKLVSDAEKDRDDARREEQLAREATKKMEQDVDEQAEEMGPLRRRRRHAKR